MVGTTDPYTILYLLVVSLKYKIFNTFLEPRVDIPENTFKRQLNALSSLHHKLVNVTSAFNTSLNTPEKKLAEEKVDEQKPAEVKEEKLEIKNEGDGNPKEEIKED